MTTRSELLSASDEAIDIAVKYCDPMVLLGLTYQLTGDEDLLGVEIGSHPAFAAEINCIAKDEDVALVQAKAAAFLKAYRDGGAGEIDLGPSERLHRSLSLTAGCDLPEHERELWMEQTALDPWARALHWKAPAPPERRSKFVVGVIGAGLSGLNAAVQLKRAGIPFVLVEKNPEVGGTWWENQYPGARVDSPSRSYTHAFGVGWSYPYAFCPQEENLKYMRWVADEFGLREHMVFETEVKSMVWDEAAGAWDVGAEGPDGPRQWRFNAVISCVGFLSRPSMPEIKGMETFEGVACHTARWPAGLDVAGRRVAVIGSGCSGYQTTPVIAKTAAHTTLFQRTPNWCFDVPAYVDPLPEQVGWLERNFPYFINFDRFRLSWMYGPDAIRAAARIDPDFKDPHAGSAANKRSRDARIAFIERKLASRPELIAKMIPDSPPMAARPVLIDSEDSVFDALLRDDVTLVTDAIEEITPTGVKAGGVDYPADVILYATGFKANDFLWPMDIRGRDGVGIQDLWAKDGARAYVGAMLPGFPNFFMAYGPNTNSWGGLQIVDFVEVVIRFALQCIGGLIVHEKQAVDVGVDAYWRFNEELDREEQSMIYMDPRADNYYRNEHGRSAANSPIDFRRMWRWLRDPIGPPPNESDAGVRPYFGEDLVVS